MYIKALIKDKSGNVFEVHVKEGTGTPDPPQGFKEQMKFAVETAKLLGKFWKEARKYANQNHMIVQVNTDNPIIAKQLVKEGFNVVFEPDFEEVVKNES